GNRRGAEGFERHRDARLEAGQELAAARAEPGGIEWGLSVGARSSSCITTLWSGTWPNGPAFSIKRAWVMRNCGAKWNRYSRRTRKATAFSKLGRWTWRLKNLPGRARPPRIG